MNRGQLPQSKAGRARKKALECGSGSSRLFLRALSGGARHVGALAFPHLISNNEQVLTRDNPRLTLEGARQILAAAAAKARDISVPMNIAVVDDGGHLLVFERMDGAKLSSIEVAMTKAKAAALRRAPTSPSPSSDQPSAVLSLGLSLATDLQLTPIRGGLPLMVGGRCVGGIGVSAGSEDEDVQVAQAGVDALAPFA